MTIGEKIRKLRKAKEWTQRRLAEEMDAGPNCVSLWENDKCEPSIFYCILLADVFDVTLDELCCRDYKR